MDRTALSAFAAVLLPVSAVLSAGCGTQSSGPPQGSNLAPPTVLVELRSPPTDDAPQVCDAAAAAAIPAETDDNASEPESPMLAEETVSSDGQEFAGQTTSLTVEPGDVVVEGFEVPADAADSTITWSDRPAESAPASVVPRATTSVAATPQEAARPVVEPRRAPVVRDISPVVAAPAPAVAVRKPAAQPPAQVAAPREVESPPVARYSVVVRDEPPAVEPRTEPKSVVEPPVAESRIAEAPVADAPVADAPAEPSKKTSEPEARDEAPLVAETAETPNVAEEPANEQTPTLAEREEPTVAQAEQSPTIAKREESPAAEPRVSVLRIEPIEEAPVVAQPSEAPHVEAVEETPQVAVSEPEAVVELPREAPVAAPRPAKVAAKRRKVSPAAERIEEKPAIEPVEEAPLVAKRPERSKVARREASAPAKPREVAQRQQKPALKPIEEAPVTPEEVVADHTELPWAVADPNSAEMKAVTRQADEHIRYGFQLAERGALFSARSEFTAALQLIAQANDAQQGGRFYTTALTSGLIALKESGDFVHQNPSKAQIDVMRIVGGHKTTILKSAAEDEVTPTIAAQRYYTYAQEELAAAGGREMMGSLALYGLGKATLASTAGRKTNSLEVTAQAMALYQAALMAEPRNFRAANELGVLLAENGNYTRARDLLLQSVSISPQAATWRNLVVVHTKLNERELAEQAQAEALVLEQSGRGNVAGPNVQWVDPETFARNIPASDSPLPPAAKPPANGPAGATDKIAAPTGKSPVSTAKKGISDWLPWNPRR